MKFCKCSNCKTQDGDHMEKHNTRNQKLQINSCFGKSTKYSVPGNKEGAPIANDRKSKHIYENSSYIMLKVFFWISWRVQTVQYGENIIF